MVSHMTRNMAAKYPYIAERPEDADDKLTVGDPLDSKPDHKAYSSVSLAVNPPEYHEPLVTDSEDTPNSPQEESETPLVVNCDSKSWQSPIEQASDGEIPRQAEKVLPALSSPSKMKTKPQPYPPSEIPGMCSNDPCEKTLRTMGNGKFAYAEVHIPSKFTSNGRQPLHGSPVMIQYVQHSTHTPERDQIWDKMRGTASFTGAAKVAKISHKSSEPCVRTWKRKEQSLVQCHPEDKVFPGSYTWFGVPERIDDSPQQVVKEQQASEEFWNTWKLESPYGMHTFMTNIHKLLQAYQEQIANGQVSNGSIAPRVVLRYGGTLLYKWEVCYVVIVTYEDDGIHDAFPPVTEPSICDDDDKPPLFVWSTLLDNEGCYGEGNKYPIFSPHHKQLDHSHYWDQVVFAVHIPPGKQLTLPKDSLVGGAPLDTKHDKHTRCHKYRMYFKPVERCQREEEKYAELQSLQGLCTSKASQKKHHTQ